jgi:hypothetical protein
VFVSIIQHEGYKSGAPLEHNTECFISLYQGSQLIYVALQWEGSDDECRQNTEIYSDQGEVILSPKNMPRLHAGYAVNMSMFKVNINNNEQGGDNQANDDGKAL